MRARALLPAPVGVPGSQASLLYGRGFRLCVVQFFKLFILLFPSLSHFTTMSSSPSDVFNWNWFKQIIVVGIVVLTVQHQIFTL